MKKYAFIFLSALCLMGLSSCENKSCDCKPQDCKYHTQTLDLTVMQPDWQFDNETNQFYFHFDLPEITWNIYNYGNWSICREYNYGQADAYQVALPQSIYLLDLQIDEVSGDTTAIIPYTQHIDYRLGVEYVEIQLTNSDYYYPAENPEDMHFRLQLIY